MEFSERLRRVRAALNTPEVQEGARSCLESPYGGSFPVYVGSDLFVQRGSILTVTAEDRKRVREIFNDPKRPLIIGGWWGDLITHFAKGLRTEVENEWGIMGIAEAVDQMSDDTLLILSRWVTWEIKLENEAALKPYLTALSRLTNTDDYVWLNEMTYWHPTVLIKGERRYIGREDVDFAVLSQKTYLEQELFGAAVHADMTSHIFKPMEQYARMYYDRTGGVINLRNGRVSLNQAN